MASSLNHCINNDAPYIDKGVFGKGRGKTGEKRERGKDKRQRGKKEKMRQGVKKRRKLGKPVGSTSLCTQRNDLKFPSLNFPAKMSASKAVLVLNKVSLHISDRTLSREIPHLCSAFSVLVSNDGLVGITEP